MRQFAMPPQKCSLSFPGSDRTCIITSLGWELVDAITWARKRGLSKKEGRAAVTGMSAATTLHQSSLIVVGSRISTASMVTDLGKTNRPRVNSTYRRRNCVRARYAVAIIQRVAENGGVIESFAEKRLGEGLRLAIAEQNFLLTHLVRPIPKTKS